MRGGLVSTAKLFSFLASGGFLILLLSSCQKEFTGDLIGSTDSLSLTGKVKTYTEDVTSASGHQVQTFNLNYDANNRIASMVSSTNPGDKFVYTYNTNNTFSIDLYNSNVLTIHSIYYLNSFSLVDSAVQDNSTLDTTTEKYIYNSAKQLVTHKEYEYTKATGSVLLNRTDYTYDSQGNVITENSGADVWRFEYYADQFNKITLGQPFFTHNTNLTKTTTFTSGGTTEVFNHTYTFDASNRVTSEKVTGNNGEVIIRSYTYF